MVNERSNMNMRSHTNQSLPGALRHLPAPVAILFLALITACASVPPAPTAKLVAARTAISDAEKADAGRYAAPELTEARNKLAEANAAVTQANMLTAGNLADQSRVEADLAMSLTAESKATSVNEEMMRNNATLVDEMKRKSGANQ
jgi:hypothetical protein